MSDKTGIEWTDATWNPVTGCAKVSQGCKHCYAEREWPRMTKLVPAYAGRDFTDVRTHGDRLDQPIRWAKRRMIFVNSMSDLFHPAVPDDFIDSVFGVMWACLYGRNEQDGHIFQVLTKRADRMRDYLNTDRREAWARAAVHHGGGIDPDGIYDQTLSFEGPHPRIWLGVSVEDQAAANERIPMLIDTPAAVRWISAEPLLGRVDLCEAFGMWWNQTMNCFESSSSSGFNRNPNNQRETAIDWVVVGGESGPKARPMHPAWARSLRDQCAAAGVPFLFKQWGEWTEEDPGETAHKDCAGVLPSGGAMLCSEGYQPPWDTMERLEQSGGVRLDGRTLMFNVGKKRAGRLLDGVQHDGYPEVQP